MMLLFDTIYINLCHWYNDKYVIGLNHYKDIISYVKDN